MKNWIFRHSTGFRNYKSVLTNSVILLGLPNAPRNLFPNYSTRGVMWIRCGESSPSHAIALKHLIYQPSTQLFPLSKLKERFRELIQLRFIKKNGQSRSKYIVFNRKAQILFWKKTLILQKVLWNWNNQKCFSFWFDKIFVMFGGCVFLQTFLWVPIVPPSCWFVPLIVWGRHSGSII
jgi:hypothetical protein